MKLSVCLILKNEGPTIYRCLDSMKGFVDEYIIGIDDTTDDETTKECEKFFADNNDIDNYEIYKFNWDNNFSAARNAGMDKASGDYILIMDGHEYFPERWYNITEGRVVEVQKTLKYIKKQIPENDWDEIFFHLYQQPFIGETPANFFLQPRIYRNGKSKIKKHNDKMIRFNRSAHNTITYTRPDNSVQYPEVILIHDAPMDNRQARSKQRIEMNIKALQKDIKEKPNDTRAYFYYANTLMEAEKWQDAIDNFEIYFDKMKNENSEMYQAKLHQAICYRSNNDNNTSIIKAHECIKIDPTRRDSYILIGDIYKDRKLYDRAAWYYNTALTNKPKLSRMFASGSSNTWLPHYKLAECYYECDKKQLAISHMKIAYKYMRHEEFRKKIEEWTGKIKNILIIDKIGSFTKEIEKHLKNKYNVIKVKQYDNSLAIWADVIWQEWADENAMQSSKTGKAIIRLHGYEAYCNCNLFNRIDWNKSRVIFVAKHIKEIMAPWTDGEVIQNGVDIDNFYIKNYKRDIKSVGYAGYINEKKNPFLLLQIIKNNPELTFHLRIDWQSPFWEAEFKRHNFKNVVYHGRYDDLNNFWNGINIVLSTSIIESFSYNIAEAMAAGCKPYIYDWNGAKDIWHEDFIFDDMPEFELEYTEHERNYYRDYIKEHYSLSKQLKKIEEFINVK